MLCLLVDQVPCIDYLQDRLTEETSQPAFSKLPFRFTEIAKVILDVSVFHHTATRCFPHTNASPVRQTI